MPKLTIESIAKQIQRIEGFAVRILGPGNGRAVRSDRTKGLHSYGFEKAAWDTFTVAKRKKERFNAEFPKFDVKVLARNGRGRKVEASGKMHLRKVRSMQ